MSVSGNLAGINFSGLSSGIDTSSIIQQLLNLEALPIRRLQTQQAQLTAKQGIYEQLKSQISSLQSATNTLNAVSTYNTLKATSSAVDVATISSNSNANAGTYNLAISQLAQTHKVSSSAQASASTALGYTGLLEVNGKGVSVDNSDTLNTIAAKINATQSGAIASVIDGGANSAYLTLTSGQSGANNKIQIVGIGDDTLVNQLGLLSGGASVREAITGGAAGWKFASSTQTMGLMLNLTGLGSTAVTVGTGSVTIDLQNDSLQTIANKINDPLNGTGATATVKAVTDNGVTKYRLEITGTSTFGNQGNVLQSLGILQRGYGSQLVTAQDANFTLDGIAITSASNSVTAAIPGATLTLLKANAVTPPTSVLSLVRDNDAAKTALKGFADAYNGVSDFIKQNGEFNKETFESGPLFGDSLAFQVQNSIGGLIFNSVSNTGGQFSNLTQLGFSFDDKGKLAVDDAKLDAALVQDPDSVSKLMRAVGSTSVSTLGFVSSSNKTKASAGDGYDVVISQTATKGNSVAGVAQTLANSGGEQLTFNGSIFGNIDYVLPIDTGLTLSQTVDKINNDTKLRDLVTASITGGKLTVTSKKFGTNGNFTVISNLVGANDNTGVGKSGSTYTTGVDVAGTINGEAADGNGQFLSGKSGNANTDGLQIQYTGAAIGVAGKVKYVKGIASIISDQIDGFTDSVSGLFTSTDKSLQSTIDDLAKNIGSLQERLKTKEQELKVKFAAMETALAQLQQQSQRLGSITRSTG